MSEQLYKNWKKCGVEEPAPKTLLHSTKLGIGEYIIYHLKLPYYLLMTKTQNVIYQGLVQEISY